MSETLRKKVTGFLSKLLLIALAATFVLWGIGDVFRGSSGGRYVAKVGEVEITPAQYRQELNLRLTAFRRMLGENYSNEMVQSLGVPEQVLNELVQRAALTQEVRELNLHVPEEALHEHIMGTEAFHGGDGFDAEIFQMTLRNANITEEAYLEALRQEIPTALLMDTIHSESLISEELVRALHPGA